MAFRSEQALSLGRETQVWLLDYAAPDAETRSTSDPCWPLGEVHAQGIHAADWSATLEGLA